MANAKEYNMLFKLSASLGREFSSTFSAAGKTMQQTQAEIRALNQQQSNITAYQKQQTAVENTSRKLSDLQKEYDNIQREIQETEGFSSSLANKAIEKQRQIDKTSASLTNQSNKLDEMQRELKEAGVNTDDLSNESKQLQAELDKLGDEMADFTDDGISGFEAVGSALIAAGIANGVKEITEAYKECVELSSEFEASMSQVAATMGVTSEEVQELSDFAKEMGAATSFTAVESSEGLNILAMAGLNTAEQISALPTVLDLAAAGAMDMATSAKYVTGTVKGFSDVMSNAGYYADLMAKGATMANTNVSQLGEAMSVSAATASSYGQSADSLVLSLLRLAEQNKTGSEAATMLNRAMADLYTPTEEASAVLDELGVKMYDLNGDARDFNDVVDELNSVLSEYSMEQQNVYKNTIFTTNGLQAYNKMCVSTSETVEKFYTGLSQASGSATQQAKTQLDNLKGAMTIFGSATEGLKITIGEQFQPELTKAVNAATELTAGLNDFAKKHPAVVKSIIAITAEASVFLSVYATYNAAKKASATLSALKTALNIKEKASQDALNASILKNPYVLAAAAVAALTVGIIALVEAQDAEEKEIRELTEASRAEYFALQEKKAEYEEAAELYGENSEEASLLKWQVDELTESYIANKQSIEEYVAEFEEMNNAWNETLDTNMETFQEISTNETTLLTLVHRLEELSNQTKKTVGDQEELKTIIQYLNKEVPDLALNYSDVVNGMDGLGDTIEQMVKAEAAVKKAEAAHTGWVDALVKQAEAEAEIADATAQRAIAEQRLEDANDARDKKYGNNYAALNELIKKFSEEQRVANDAQKSIDDYDNTIKEAQETWNKAADDIETYKAALVDGYEAQNGVTEEQQRMNEAISATITEVETLVEKYNEAYKTAYDSINGQYSLWDEAAAVAAISTSTITSNLADQEKYWADYNTNLLNLQQRSGEIEGLSAVISSFADGSEESVNAIAGMAKATDEELKAMVTQWQETQEQQKAASQSLADLVTEFSTQMDILSQDLAEDIKAMDLSEEAVAAGEKTIQGFIDGAASKNAAVYQQYKELGQQAVAALKAQIENASITATVEVVSAPIDGYASGTDYATPGVHIVGENGPELMMFRGGERVVNADKTAEILNKSHGSVSVNVAPSIVINGNASEDTASVISEEIVTQVLDALQEAGIDAARRQYI